MKKKLKLWQLTCDKFGRKLNCYPLSCNKYYKKLHMAKLDNFNLQVDSKTYNKN